MVAAALAGGGVVAFGGVPGLTLAAQAAPAPAFTLSVTPTQGLTDGETMTLTVTRTAAGTAAGLEIASAVTGWCAPGADLPATTSAAITSPGQGFPVFGPGAVCTTQIHPSLNADPLPVSGISPPVNGSGDYPTVTAVVAAQTTSGAVLQFGTVACDADHPCLLAVAVWTTLKTHTTTSGPVSILETPVSYLPTSVNTACGGAAPGEFESVGPDRLGTTVTHWTLDACGSGLAGGKAVAANTASGEGDATALCAFASGNDDLAYSAVGYGASTSPFNPAECQTGAEPDRPYVAVPVAVNAVVLAHAQTQVITTAGGQLVFGNYPQLNLTDTQAAHLLGGGPRFSLTWTGPLGQSIVGENPSLTGDYDYTPHIAVTTGNLRSGTQQRGVVATSLTDATSLFATTYFHTVVPDALLTQTTPPGQLGAVANLGSADPAFNVYPATGTQITTKDLTPGPGQPWALVDAATSAATWGGMADVALQSPGSIGSSTPLYVGPTTASMDAALPGMLRQPDGTLAPNPNAPVSQGVVPYPLTYVEYAIAPTRPLMNADCQPRTRSQQDLTDWLDYITGPGQTELPNGMAPLTPALQAQARSAITKVGTAASTGACPPTASLATTSAATGTPGSGSGTAGGGAAGQSSGSPSPAAALPSPSGVTGSGGASTFGAPNFRPGAGNGVNGGGPTGAATKGGAATTPFGAHSTGVDLSDFRVREGPSWLFPVVGVVLIFLLLPGLVLLASGRSPRRTLADWRRRSSSGTGS